MNSEKKPSVTVKKKNIHTILDYCLDTKQEFTVLPKMGTDEWNIEINITFLIPKRFKKNGIVKIKTLLLTRLFLFFLLLSLTD